MSESETSRKPPRAIKVLPGDLPWEERLAFVLETMRQLSRQTDPQEMVRTYRRRLAQILPLDGSVSLSRRDLERPKFRVTRSHLWGEDFDPWKNPEKVPTLEGGILADLIYGNEPAIIDDVVMDEGDPAYPFLEGMGSLCAIPLYDNDEAINMVVVGRRERAAFDRETLPELVWTSNLFGRAAFTQVLRNQLKESNEAMDRELRVVGEIQRGLLPEGLPAVSGMELSVHYRTSTRAGGDYYDFFALHGADGKPAGSASGRWGILIADVSGHGTPAAVLMAVTHSIAHTRRVTPARPGQMLEYINQHLVERYTTDNGTFVTAFYGIWDPSTRTIEFANAGHPPPLIRPARGGGAVRQLRDRSGLPLGIDAGERYADSRQPLAEGDTLVLFTDGITEARETATREFFGVERLGDSIAAGGERAEAMAARLLSDLETFTGGAPPSDDRTLLVARLS
jgi:phosphoserine phosphatase RsbU/P